MNGMLRKRCVRCGVARQQAPTKLHCPTCHFPIRPLQNRYRVLERYSKGGFGSLFLAEDSYIPGKLVLVKILQQSHIDCHRTKEHFEREIRITAAMSRIDHRVVEVLAFGEEAGIGLYYVMEFLQGQSLAQMIAHDEIEDWEMFYGIFGQLSGTLSVLHRCGIVHNDLKPENIMICKDEDDNLVVKLIDFGLANNIAAIAPTPKGQPILGSPHYMSPERCFGEAYGPASDQYAFAVIMYEVLSGMAPLGHGATDAMQVLYAQIQEQPKAFAALFPSQQMYGAIEKALLKALQKKAVDRFASVELFWQALSDRKRFCMGLLPRFAPQGWASETRDELPNVYGGEWLSLDADLDAAIDRLIIP